MELIEVILRKFMTLDLESMHEKGKSITDMKESREIPDPIKVEEFVRLIPGFTLSEMVNFGAYCSETFAGKSVTEKELEDTLLEWLKKNG